MNSGGPGGDRSGWVALAPLLLLGVALLFSNSAFTFIDDEVIILGAAAKPLRATLGAFASGLGEHEHPPLSDILLHGWLRLTNGRMSLLRLPSILFFLAGLYVLSKAAGRLAGPRGELSLLWIGALWPYGFHFGRLAGWYSLCFFLIAALTLAYLQWVEHLTVANGCWLFAAGAALVYTNYFGWALIACLGADFVLFHWPKALRHWLASSALALALVAAYVPLLRALFARIPQSTRVPASFRAAVLSECFSVYTLFVSESVAPWVWAMSIAASCAVALCLAGTLFSAPSPAKRFLVYGLFLDTALVALGLFNTKRLILIAPWLLLPVAAALARPVLRSRRRWLLASLCVIAGIGWFGILSRQFYAAPRFIEPWSKVARQMAQNVSAGGVVIGNNLAFFFYLTYAAPATRPGEAQRFQGFLPYDVRHPQIFDPQMWLQAGRPLGPKTVLVKGQRFGAPREPMEATEQWLEQRCRPDPVHRLLPNEGFALKQRYFPELGQLPWRIEIRSYACPRAAPSSP